MKAVILAGGLGMRLRPLTDVIPKPLLPIGERSLLEIQIGRLKACGFDEVFLATNYKADYITNFFGDGSRYGVRLTESRETEPLGTAGPLSLLRDKLDAPFVLMNGDILSTIDFRVMYDHAVAADADLCVAVKRIVTPFAFGRISHADGYVTAIEEKPSFEFDVLAGIYVVKPALLALIPDRTYYGMDKLIQRMLAEKRRVARHSLHEYWLDIGQLPDYESAKGAYEKHFAGLEGPRP